MAIVQSDWGRGQRTTPFAGCMGNVVAEKFTFIVSKDLALDDIIEMGVLPAGHDIVDAVLYADQAGTTKFDVGIMTGEVGDALSNRTCGTELFADAGAATYNRLASDKALRLKKSDVHRSIGVKVKTAGITASAQVITLLVQYRAA